MKKLCSVAALVIAAAGSTASAQIWDQLNNPIPNAAYASQIFEPANASFNIAAIDDFTVSSASVLGSVDFSMIYYNGTGPVTSWRVAIYSSPAAAVAGNLVGDVANITGLPGGQVASPFPTFVHLNVPATNLAAGNYWIGIIGVMDFGVGGQVGIAGRSVVTGNGARQINPGGGFGQGPDFPILNGGQPVDLLFRLNAVPAPGSLALLGLGGLAAFRRRR
jgi:hypothetical protein